MRDEIKATGNAAAYICVVVYVGLVLLTVGLSYAVARWIR